MRAVHRWAVGGGVLSALACGGGGGSQGEAAAALVRDTFAARRVDGAVGVEALGKGVWFRAEAFNSGCLEQKEWAHRDRSGGEAPRISPNYEAQSVFQQTTPEGWCVWIGDGLQMQTGAVNRLGDAWVVDVTFTQERPGGWWECVAEEQRQGVVRVREAPDGALSIEKEPALWGGACPRPLPVVNPSRTAARPPKAPPPRPPTGPEVQAAVKAFDDALYDHDLQAALDALACWNLFEKEPFGACSAAELVAVGPLPRGASRREDGTPWSQNQFSSFEGFGRPEPDRKDPTLFHVEVKPGDGKRPRRTISLQWVEGGWRLVGAVQRKAEGLTSVELVLDLDRKEKREIFDRRVAGEPIDAQGNPLDGKEPPK